VQEDTGGFMHSRNIRNTVLIISAVFLLFSCEKSGTGSRAALSFSDDTVYFDTVFATVGSTTRELRVRNTQNGKIIIDEISLAGGANSMFRLNIDGEPAVSKTNVEIEAGDSVFVFVDVFVDPSNSNSPVAVTDSILFRVSGELMKVYLLAWGQDIVLIQNSVIGSAIWNKERPYVIYGNVIVDTLETLNVEEGSRIYFHKNASLTMAGNIIASGSTQSPVLMASDRTEKIYEEVPGMWSGLFFLNTSNGNRINNTIIRNSVNGLHVGEAASSNSVPDLKLFNSKIYHSTITALAVIKGNIEAVNSVFSHCGKYCISIRAGGSYSFVQCTIFNIWDWGYRLTPSLFVSEKPVMAGGTARELYLDIDNSSIYGDLISEIEIEGGSKSLKGNYFFDHCLIRLDTITCGFWNREWFPGVIVNKDPKFIDHFSWDFRPDTLSPLIDRGDPQYLVEFPVDIRGASRLTDGFPDIGAYERIPGEMKKNN
jgi:hypothetical protein